MRTFVTNIIIKHGEKNVINNFFFMKESAHWWHFHLLQSNFVNNLIEDFDAICASSILEDYQI